MNRERIRFRWSMIDWPVSLVVMDPDCYDRRRGFDFHPEPTFVWWVHITYLEIHKYVNHQFRYHYGNETGMVLYMQYNICARRCILPVAPNDFRNYKHAHLFGFLMNNFSYLDNWHFSYLHFSIHFLPHTAVL